MQSGVDNKGNATFTISWTQATFTIAKAKNRTYSVALNGDAMTLAKFIYVSKSPAEQPAVYVDGTEYMKVARATNKNWNEESS